MRQSDRLGGLYEETGLFVGKSVEWRAMMARWRGEDLDVPFRLEALSPEAAHGVWLAYGETIGLDTLRAAYGAYWPRRPVPGEHVWLAMAERACGEAIGWLSLRRDPVDPWMWLALGIYPTHQRRGWASRLRQAGVRVALEDAAVEGVMLEVLNSNPAHVCRWRQRIDHGEWPGWQEAGVRTAPAPGAVLFWHPRQGGAHA